MGLLGAVHVGVHARGAHADVVGDEDADARTGEDPVVEALEVDQTSRREGICLVFQGPVARGCALVALADGAAADDDRRPLAGAGPRHGRFDHVTADRDRIAVHVGGGIQHLGHRGRERVVQLRRHGSGGCGGGAQNGSRGAGGDGRGVVEGLVDGGGIVGGAQRTERTGCVAAFGTAVATGTGTRAVTCIGGRQSRETGDGGQLGDVRGGAAPEPSRPRSGWCRQGTWRRRGAEIVSRIACSGLFSKRKASWAQFVQKVPPASEFAPNGGDMGTAAERGNAVRRPHPVFPPAKPGISYRP